MNNYVSIIIHTASSAFIVIISLWIYESLIVYVLLYFYFLLQNIMKSVFVVISIYFILYTVELL